MRSTENLSGGKDVNIHAAISHPLPTPGLPGTKSVPAELKPAPDKKGRGHKVRNFVVGTGVSALAAVSAVAAGQHHFENDVPISPAGIAQDIGAIPGQVAEWFKPEVIVSPFFDPNANNGTIGNDINTIASSQGSLKIAYEEQVNQGNDGPTVIVPIKFTAPDQKVDYEYAKPLTNSTDSQTGLPVTQEFPGRITFQLDKDVEIPVVAENAEIFQFEPSVIDGKEYFVGIFIKWQQNGDTYGLRIAGADARTFQPLGDLTTAPIVPITKQGGLDLSGAKNGLKLPLGTSLAKVDLSSAEVSLNFDKYNPQTGRWESKRPNFVTDKSTGQSKLMLPQNNN